MTAVCAHGGDIYGNDIDLDYSISVNPLGMPAAARKAFAASAVHLERYPDRRCRDLREKTAAFESNGICPEDLVFGNGAAELIYALCQALHPENVYLTAPGFGEYERAAKSTGAEIHFLYLKENDDFHMPYINDFSRIKPALRPGSIVFISNPLHPSGTIIDSDILQSLVMHCEQRKVWICVDECFLDLCPGFTDRTLKPYLWKCKYLIILRAFTKIFAMPGLRLGYIISKSQSLHSALTSVLQPWNISVPAQEAGAAAVSDLSAVFEYLAKTKRYIRREKDYLRNELTGAGLVEKIYDSSANYIFFKAAPGLYEQLLSRKVLIRSFRDDRGLDDRFGRVCIRSHTENEELIRRWKQV